MAARTLEGSPVATSKLASASFKVNLNVVADSKILLRASISCLLRVPFLRWTTSFKTPDFWRFVLVTRISRDMFTDIISDLAEPAQNNPKSQETIANSIVDVVQGMFLLAQLDMDQLTDMTSLKAIKLALEKLPMGSDALDLAYDQAMKRIELSGIWRNEL